MRTFNCGFLGLGSPLLLVASHVLGLVLALMRSFLCMLVVRGSTTILQSWLLYISHDRHVIETADATAIEPDSKRPSREDSTPHGMPLQL